MNRWSHCETIQHLESPCRVDVIVIAAPCLSPAVRQTTRGVYNR